MKRKSMKIASAALVALVLVGACVAYSWGTKATHTCTVTAKEPVAGMNGQARGYRISTAECGEFDVDDAPLHGVWEPGDLFRSIEVGGVYTLTTTGWRLPALDRRPTVIAAAAAG